MEVLRYEKDLSKIFKEPYSYVNVIFLAGPTPRKHQSHIKSWRYECIDEFKKQGFNGYLIVPEFETSPDTDESINWLPQWEFKGLISASVIMFWVPRTKELIGLTTNHELGYWMARKREKVIYGRPDDAYKISYLDTMWNEDAKDRNKELIPITNTLKDTVKSAIELNEKLIKKYGKKFKVGYNI